MKDYIKKFKPRVTLVLIGVLFLSNILTLYLPKFSICDALSFEFERAIELV